MATKKLTKAEKQTRQMEKRFGLNNLSKRGEEPNYRQNPSRPVPKSTAKYYA
jgi:hypothetical protein